MLAGTRKRVIGSGFAVTTAAVALSLALWVAAALARPGDLDTSFSGDGKLTTSITSGVDSAYGVAIQADAKIVVVGHLDISDGFAVARYNPDGTLDTSSDSTPGTNFDGDGIATLTSTGDGDLAEAFDVAIQPGDQKIVVAGYGYNSDSADGSEDFALARFNADGSLDAAGFGGGDGTVFTRFAAMPDTSTYDYDRAEAVGIQSDGDIVAAGYGDPTFGGNVRDFAVAHYDSNGDLDNAFGGDGKVTLNILGVDTGHDLALLSGDKVLVVGSTISASTGTGWALARFEADGDPDPTFDGNGVRTRNFTGVVDSLESVQVQGDGKIVAGGNSGDNFAVARFNSTGSDDNGFDGNGYITTTFNSSTYNQTWNGLAIEGNGKIVTAGGTYYGGGNDFAVGRFNANGSVDRTFGANCSGARRTDFGDADAAEGLALDSSGRLVTAGYAGLDFGVARYTSGSAALADCIVPDTRIQGPRKTTKRRPTYRLISTEAGSTFRCRINGRNTSKPYNPCSSPFKMPRLPLGPTRFEVKAVDKAGNVDPTPAFLKIKRIRRR